LSQTLSDKISTSTERPVNQDDAHATIPSFERQDTGLQVRIDDVPCRTTRIRMRAAQNVGHEAFVPGFTHDVAVVIDASHAAILVDVYYFAANDFKRRTTLKRKMRNQVQEAVKKRSYK
jgi:hypothetical protein